MNTHTMVKITPKQAAALRAFSEDIVELSPFEVAVRARILPHEARKALAALEQNGIVSSSISNSGQIGEHLFFLNSSGRKISRALTKFPSTPPVGTIMRLDKRLPFVHRLLSQESVQIIAEQTG